MTRLHTWITGLSLAATLAAAGCGGGNATEAAAQTTETPAEPGIPVEVVTVEGQPFTEHIRVVGDVEADRSVTVSAEEGGVVRRLFADDGAEVDANAPLVKVDDRVLRAQVAQAEADAELARESHERQRRLWESEGIGTEMAYLQAKYGADRAVANLELLRTRLERTTVRAPFAGVVDARRVELGSMVSPGAPVAQLVDVDTIRVVAGVPERYAGDVEVGASASVNFDILSVGDFEGEIAFVGTVVNQQNRTFPIEVVVPNPNRMIKPGMVANVRIVRRTTDDAVLVPQDAVLRTADGYTVYVAEERAGRLVALARTITLGVAAGDRVLVRSGLEPGDRVIVVGHKQVAEGNAIRIVEGVRGE